MQEELPARVQSAGQEVGVKVAAEQERLEEQQACRPHRRRAAEPRKDELADERLDQEEQESTQQNREAVKRHRQIACSSLRRAMSAAE